MGDVERVCVMDEAKSLDIAARNGAWPIEVKARAYELWSSTANRSASFTERLLADEARAEAAVQGEDVLPEPVPSQRTIREWALMENWGEQASRYTLATYQRDYDQLQEMQWNNQRLAVETFTVAMSGGMDHLPTSAVNARLKAAELTRREWGAGTWGANQGGEQRLDPTKGIVEGEQQEVSLAERARRMREKISDDNQRG